MFQESRRKGYVPDNIGCNLLETQLKDISNVDVYLKMLVMLSSAKSNQSGIPTKKTYNEA